MIENQALRSPMKGASCKLPTVAKPCKYTQIRFKRQFCACRGHYQASYPECQPWHELRHEAGATGAPMLQLLSSDHKHHSSSSCEVLLSVQRIKRIRQAKIDPEIHPGNFNISHEISSECLSLVELIHKATHQALAQIYSLCRSIDLAFIRQS